LFRFSRPGAAIIPFKQLLSYTHEAEWTPFQTHYFSENLVAPEIDPGISGSVATTEAAVHYKRILSVQYLI
jgi:hypothetical protein